MRFSRPFPSRPESRASPHVGRLSARHASDDPERARLVYPCGPGADFTTIDGFRQSAWRHTRRRNSYDLLIRRRAAIDPPSDQITRKRYRLERGPRAHDNVAHFQVVERLRKARSSSGRPRRPSSSDTSSSVAASAVSSSSASASKTSRRLRARLGPDVFENAPRPAR